MIVINSHGSSMFLEIQEVLPPSNSEQSFLKCSMSMRHGKIAAALRGEREPRDRRPTFS